MDAHTLLKLRNYLSVAHHIPGRIRIKIKPDILGDPGALELAKSMDFSSWKNGEGSSGIINSRFNFGAGSLIIEYDYQIILPDLIGELFSTSDPDRVNHLAEELAGLLGFKYRAQP